MTIGTLQHMSRTFFGGGGALQLLFSGVVFELRDDAVGNRPVLDGVL